MEKLVKFGLLLLVVSLIGISFLVINTQVVAANEEEVAEEDDAIEVGLTEAEAYSDEKAKAIANANKAIRDIPNPDRIIAYEEAFIQSVAKALSLVAYAREEHGAKDSDFVDLAKLNKAEKKVLLFLAIQAAKDAIDKIPPLSEITEEHRAIIEEARRLVNIAMKEHGATEFQLCWRYYYLKDAEDELDDVVPEPKPEPKPEPEKPTPTPPTGGLSGLVAMGILLSGAGFLFIRQRQGRH